MNWLVQRLARYAYQRALEASTWRNLILLAGGTWTAKHPDQADLLVPLCLALAGFVGSFFPDLLGAERLESHADETVPFGTLPPIELQGRAMSVCNPSVGGMRPSVPSDRGPGTPEPSGPQDSGFGDRG